MTTPTTPEGLARWDHLPWPDNALAAWMDTGPNPEHHRREQDVVREAMPLVARALDREAAQKLTGERRTRRRNRPENPPPVPWQDDG